jgi:hypothetical protein
VLFVVRNKMIAFHVSLNGKRICTAGAEDLAVLSAIVSAVGRLGANTIRARPREKVDINYSVRGLTRRTNNESDEHLLWKPLGRLRVGDVLTVKVLKTKQVDRARSRHKAGRKRREPSGFRQRRAPAVVPKRKSADRRA